MNFDLLMLWPFRLGKAKNVNTNFCFKYVCALNASAVLFNEIVLAMWDLVPSWEGTIIGCCTGRGMTFARLRLLGSVIHR